MYPCLTAKIKETQQKNNNVRKKGRLDGYVIRNDVLFKNHNGDTLLFLKQC